MKLKCRIRSAGCGASKTRNQVASLEAVSYRKHCRTKTFEKWSKTSDCTHYFGLFRLFSDYFAFLWGRHFEDYVKRGTESPIADTVADLARNREWSCKFAEAG